MLREITKATSLLLCVLSGVLLALPFNNGNLWIFAWFGFVPAFYALNNKSYKQTFLLFFITGIVFWSGTIYWLAHVTLAGTIILILYLALYFAVFGLLIRPCTKHSTPYALIFIPSVWVLLEYARGHLLTGFPWALLGYSQYLNLPVIQIADITGAMGISFLLISANVAVVEIIYAWTNKLQARLRTVAAVLFLFLLLNLFYGYYRLNQTPGTQHLTPIKVSVIQGNVPQELKWNPRAKDFIIDKYLDLTKAATLDKPDLIVWPEAALPIVPQEAPELFNKVRDFVNDTSIPLLLGAVTADEELYYNSALLVYPGSKGIAGYNKVHLVPFGEYIPLRNLLPFLETVVPIGDVEPGREYVVFKITNHTVPAGRQESQITNFSVLICFEDVFPELSRRFVRQGADFLVNITNDAWYKQTPAAYQHLQASVFRAVENRVFIVRSANTGVSAFISPLGKIITTVRNGSGKEIFVSGYKTSDIIAKGKAISFYTRSGDIFILGCMIIFILGGVIRGQACLPPTL